MLEKIKSFFSRLKFKIKHYRRYKKIQKRDPYLYK
jgi:hypothetical protein